MDGYNANEFKIELHKIRNSFQLAETKSKTSHFSLVIKVSMNGKE